MSAVSIAAVLSVWGLLSAAPVPSPDPRPAAIPAAPPAAVPAPATRPEPKPEPKSEPDPAPKPAPKPFRPVTIPAPADGLEVGEVQLSPDGRHVLVRLGDAGNDLAVHDLENGGRRVFHWKTEGTEELYDFRWLPDGSGVVISVGPSVADDDSTTEGKGRLDVLSVKDGSLVRRVKHPGQAHSDLAITPDGKALVAETVTKRKACGDEDFSGMVRSVDLATGKGEVLFGLGRNRVPQHMSPARDGKHVLLVEDRIDEEGPGTLQVRTLKDGEVKLTLKPDAQPPPDTSLQEVMLSADGKRAAAVYVTHADEPAKPFTQVILWDVATGKQIAALPFGGEPERLTVAPDFKTLWMLRDGKLTVHDITEGGIVTTVTMDGMRIADVVLSPDGRRVALKTSAGAILVRDVAGLLAEKGHVLKAERESK